MCSALRHGSALQFYLFVAGFDSTSLVGTLGFRCIQSPLLALLHAVGHREGGPKLILATAFGGKTRQPASDRNPNLVFGISLQTPGKNELLQMASTISVGRLSPQCKLSGHALLVPGSPLVTA